MSSNQLSSLGSWTAFAGGFPLLDFAPEQAALERDLVLNFPMSAVRVPQPPAWLDEMTSEWRQQWERLKSPDATGMNPSTGSNLLEQLGDTTRNGVVHFNLDLERARRLMSTDRTAARQELVRLARMGPGQLSETGVPLPNIAMALLLRITEPNEVDEEFWTALRDQVFHVPSLLTPALLEQAKPLITRVTHPSGLPAALHALNTCWDGFERLRDLSEGLRSAGVLKSTNAAAAWIHTSRGRYLAICRRAD
ncbi:MAG: hypothetical protein EXS36_10495 [Pedosphaera sp.]|nr:hypothetical protein [Pedosphaera sp.]